MLALFGRPRFAGLNKPHSSQTDVAANHEPMWALPRTIDSAPPIELSLAVTKSFRSSSLRDPSPEIRTVCRIAPTFGSHRTSALNEIALVSCFRPSPAPRAITPAFRLRLTRRWNTRRDKPSTTVSGALRGFPLSGALGSFPPRANRIITQLFCPVKGTGQNSRFFWPEDLRVRDRTESYCRRCGMEG